MNGLGEFLDFMSPRMRKLRLTGDQLAFLRVISKYHIWTWTAAPGTQPIHQVFDPNTSIDRPLVGTVDLREFPPGIFSNVVRTWQLTLFGQAVGQYHNALTDTPSTDNPRRSESTQRSAPK